MSDRIIRVVESQKPHRAARWTLATPFAGKDFCWSRYCRGIRGLPLREAHAVWWDNSNSSSFRRRLVAALRRLFTSYTLIEDRAPAMTIERTIDCDLIDGRAFEVYRELFKLLPDLPLTFVVEDDVEVPAGAFERLKGIFEAHPKVGTAAGCQRERRPGGHPGPVAWNFEREVKIPPGTVVYVRPIYVAERAGGVEWVGGTAFGCWLTRTKLIKRFGAAKHVDGSNLAVDQTWGYRLNVAGHAVALDWSVVCRHYFQMSNGTVSYV